MRSLVRRYLPVLFLLALNPALITHPSAHGESLSPVPVIVKLRPPSAAGADTQVNDFRARHGLGEGRRVHGARTRLKNGKGVDDRQLTQEVRRRFPARARRQAGPSPDLSNIYVFQASAPSRAAIAELLAKLASDPDVLYAEEDKVARISLVPNDPFYSTAGTWGQTYDDLYGLKKLGAASAWDSGAGAGVTVAVVDTGIDYTHADLANNIWINPNEVPGNGIDDDANGYVDDVRGWDFIGAAYWQPTPDADPADGHGHGTHVAGTIAAEGNNGIGIIGVAWQAKVMAVKGLDDSGSGYDSQLASAIVYAADNGADVINASFGGKGRSQAIEDAVAYATSVGVVFVAAAGNSADDARRYYPAGLANAITVAASDASDTLAYFSNFGPKIDVAAPGVDILSLRAPGTSGGTPLNDGYTRMSGTSMAAPHVAGVAALVIGQHPDYSTSQVRQSIRITAADIGTQGFDETFGYGRLNATQAVLIDGALNAAIDLPADSARLTGVVNITGYAFGSDFASYELHYGSGATPSQWTMISETSTPAGGAGPAPHIPVSGPLGVLDTSTLADGLYTIRLTVRDASNRTYVDRRLVIVDYVNITSPAPPVSPSEASTLGTGTMLPIEGKAAGASFSSYRIEWARGVNPASGWSTAGVNLEQGGTVPVADGLLGAWDTTGVSQGDYYTIRLVVENAGFASETRTLVYLEPDLLTTGWPKRLNPLTWPGVEAYTARGAAGQRLLTIHSAISGNLKFWKFSADGSLEGSIEDSAGGYGVGQGAVAELDGEPGDEFVVAHGNFLRVLRGNGASQQLPTTWPFVLSNAVPVVEDLDGTGGPEILAVASNHPAGTGTLLAWRADGTPLGGAFPVALANANQSLRNSGIQRLLVADLDGDGAKEIVVAEGPTATSIRLTLLNADGTPRPWGAMPYEGELHRIAAGDVDGDGALEVLALVRNPDFTRTLHVLGVDGAEKTGWPFTLPNGESGLALADFDRDGKLEIVVPAAYKLYLFRGDGQPFSPAWPRTLQDGYGIYYFGLPVAADVDGDGIPEIVFATFRNATASNPLFPLNGGATAASGTTYYYEYKVTAMRRDGTVLRSWRVPTTAGQEIAGLALPVVADVDGDGETDIVITAPTAASGESWVQDSVLSVLTTRSPYASGANDWPSQRRDSRNSAVFPRDRVAPAISITSPQSSATVSRTVMVSAAASDNVYLRGVQFKVDGVDLGAEDVSAPFEVEWDSRLSGNGPHVLTAVARDSAGNQTTSGPVNVTVETDVTAPTVAIASPAPGASVASPLTVVVNTADPGGIARVELYVDSVLAGTDTSAPFEFSWNPSGGDGPRTLVAKAVDADGNVGTSEPVGVVVNVAPQVVWSHPTPGMVVSGLIGLLVDATDNTGVVRVEFYANDALVATDTAAPWHALWDGGAMVDGPYTFRAVAYDGAGNSENATVSVTVKNLPKPLVTSPAPSSTVTGPVQVTATATDPGGITHVELLVNGVAIASDSDAPYVFNWDPTSLADGWHDLRARAYDTAGNVGTSLLISVRVAIAPAAAITAPVSGAVLAGTTTVTANASDNTGVVRTELFVDGVLAVTDTTAPWSFALNTVAYGDGPHALTVKAYDAAGNSTTSATVAVTMDNDLAAYDPVLKAPKCETVQASCSSGALLNGRSTRGPEPNYPNTINASCSDGTGGFYHSDESNDRIVVSTLDGSPLAAGKTVRVTATVWAYSGYANDRLDLYYTANAQSPTWTLIGTFTPPGAGAQTINAAYTLPTGPLQAVRARFRYAGAAAACGTGSFDDHDDLAFAVETPTDSGPPTVAITSPTAGSNVTGAMVVTIDAADDLGVTKVELYSGATLVGTDVAAPYAITWSPFLDGSYSLMAKAYDVVGNVTTSSAVAVTVAVPPAVSITSPAGGSIVTGPVTITAQATDNTGVSRVEFFVDGSLRSTDSASPYTYAWDTATEAIGSHTLTAKAFDLAGTAATSAPVAVQVQPPGAADALYDAVLKAPRCSAFGSVCDSGGLLVGRGTRGPEPNFSNTINNSCTDGSSGTFHSDESNDRIRVSTLDGTDLAGGKTVRIEATVWAYSGYSSDKLDLYYATNASAPVWTLVATLTPTKAGSQVLSATYTLPSGSSLQAVRANFRYSGSASACTTGPYDDRDDLVFAVRQPQ